MKLKTRWGIVGTGSVAGHFAADFAHTTDSTLHAICSRQQANAEAFAKTYGASKAYNSYKAMLADDAVDVVYIALPHHLHQQYSLEAFAAGKAVLCEKPFTLNASEAEVIIRAAREQNLFCMEGMWMRCMPLIAEIKSRIDAGEIGTVEHIHAEFGYPTAFDPSSRFYDLNQAGGSLLDRGIYPLTLAFHLLGKPVLSRGEALIGRTGVDESSCYHLEFANGATAELCSTLTGYASNAAIIRGSHGWIRIHPPFYRPDLISIHKGKAPQRPHVSAACDGSNTNRVTQKLRRVLAKLSTRFGSSPWLHRPVAGHGYQFEIDEVARCLRQGLTESPLVPLDDTLAILQTMDQLRSSWGLKYPQER